MVKAEDLMIFNYENKKIQTYNPLKCHQPSSPHHRISGTGWKKP